MSGQTKVVASHHDPSRASLGLYIGGFLASLLLTMTSYLLVAHRLIAGNTALIATIIGLALIQFMVQLVCFLHLGLETKPRWKLLVFGFMITIVLILVIGSLWIMSNLNYRMTPQQINQYLNGQDGL